MTLAAATTSEAPKVITSANLRADQKANLAALAGSRDSSVSAELRRAIDFYLRSELSDHPYVSLVGKRED